MIYLIPKNYPIYHFMFMAMSSAAALCLILLKGFSMLRSNAQFHPVCRELTYRADVHIDFGGLRTESSATENLSVPNPTTPPAPLTALQTLSHSWHLSSCVGSNPQGLSSVVVVAGVSKNRGSLYENYIECYLSIYSKSLPNGKPQSTCLSLVFLVSPWTQLNYLHL